MCIKFFCINIWNCEIFISSLLYQITTMKALPNNNKPATHFIEVWKLKIGLPIYDEIKPIEILGSTLLATAFLDYKTIAIFKIRLK